MKAYSLNLKFKGKLIPWSDHTPRVGVDIYIFLKSLLPVCIDLEVLILRLKMKIHSSLYQTISSHAELMQHTESKWKQKIKQEYYGYYNSKAVFELKHLWFPLEWSKTWKRDMIILNQPVLSVRFRERLHASVWGIRWGGGLCLFISVCFSTNLTWLSTFLSRWLKTTNSEASRHN